MDFLDSLDLHGNDHKSNRMRSWYLYEQYKSLERHQLDAAERLKERSYQERLLHQELTERRARRSLYQQRGLCRSEPYVDRKDTLSISTDDFYPSFCELQDEEVVHTIEADLASVGSRDDSEIDKTEYFNTLEDNDDSNDSSVKSVVLKSKSDEKLDTEILNEEIKEDLEFEKCDIAENINLQLEAVKENIQSLEKYARLSDVGESESSNSSETCKLPVVESSNKNLSIYESNIFVMWSRLVSFAYQVIQLNHGNCYYDYGSQLMTAVLACDVLRRGVNRMCDFLQPYVSPIKFATDEIDIVSNNCYKKVKRKTYSTSKNSKQTNCKLNSSVFKASKRRFERRHNSESFWRDPNYNFEARIREKCRRASEPWRSAAQLIKNRCSTSSMWSADFDSGTGYRCHCRKVVNPMQKLVRYLDDVLYSDLNSELWL